MTSFIPNRKPDTPIQPLITVGNYQSKIDFSQFKRLSAAPGAASSIFERNKRASDEIQIKPITQNKVSLEHYNPKHYLSPYQFTTEVKDVALNSIHSTRVYNRKQAAIGRQNSAGMQSASELPIVHTQTRGKFNGWSGSMSTTNMMATNSGMSKGNLLPENRNYISQNENEFYKSNKIFYKPSTSYNKYSYSTPDYFKIDQKAIDMNKTGQTYKPGETVTVVSRNNGWLTVDPNTMSRKNAFENQSKGNLHKTSHMSPGWMQTEAKRDEQQMQKFKPQTVKRQNIRCEENRLFLADRQEPAKSIFNLGQIRHNLLTKDDASKQLEQMKNYSTQPVRFLEWKETPNKQAFDSAKVTGKIGSNF